MINKTRKGKYTEILFKHSIDKTPNVPTVYCRNSP